MRIGNVRGKFRQYGLAGKDHNIWRPRSLDRGFNMTCFILHSQRLQMLTFWSAGTSGTSSGSTGFGCLTPSLLMWNGLFLSEKLMTPLANDNVELAYRA